MLHCHNLYHMKTGMARVVKYASFNPKKEIAEVQSHDPHLHDHIYHTGLLEAATNHAQAKMRFTRTWDMIDTRLETRKSTDGEWDPEGDLLYRRIISQIFNLVGGATFAHDETHANIGFGYTLPMLIETHVLLDHEGHFRVDLEKKVQWTKTIFSHLEFTLRQGHEAEYEVTLMYGPNWHWSGGLMLTEENIGAGVEYRF